MRKAYRCTFNMAMALTANTWQWTQSASDSLALNLMTAHCGSLEIGRYHTLIVKMRLRLKGNASSLANSKTLHTHHTTHHTMNKATLTTTSGHTWTTSINGSFEEVCAYFLGKRFTVGSYDETKPNEGFTLEEVTSLVYNDTQTATL